MGKAMEECANASIFCHFNQCSQLFKICKVNTKKPAANLVVVVVGGQKKNKHLLPGQGLCVVNKKLSVEKIDEQKRKKTR